MYNIAAKMLFLKVEVGLKEMAYLNEWKGMKRQNMEKIEILKNSSKLKT